MINILGYIIPNYLLICGMIMTAVAIFRHWFRWKWL